MGLVGLLDFGMIVGDLGLGAVVTAPIAMVSIWLKELPSPGRGDPAVLAEPFHEMATVEGMGGELGGPLPEGGHGEVAKFLVREDDPGVHSKVCPCIGDDGDIPEHV